MEYRNSAWLLALVLFASAAQSAQLELVSSAALPAAALSNGSSTNARVSADLRYVVFESYADNLVAGDSNRRSDIVLVDRIASTRRVISRTTAAAGDGDSYGADISADGSTIVFSSAASNLVADDSNQQTDLFVLNRITGVLRRLLPSAGVQPDGRSHEARISDNGQRVVFTSDATNWVGDDSNGVADVFVYDLAGNTVQRASLTSASLEALGYIGMPDISADGSCILFHADSGDFVPGDQNGSWDVFVRDLGEQETRRVSIGFDGRESDEVMFGSGQIIDCGTVVFASFDGDLAFPDSGSGAWLYRHSPGFTDLVYDMPTNITRQNYALSRNGGYLLFGLEAGALAVPFDLQRINLSNLTVTEFSGLAGFPDFIADDGGTVFAHSARSLAVSDRNLLEDLFIATVGGSFEILSTPAAAAPLLIANGASGRADHADPLTPGVGTRTQSVSGDGNLVLFNSIATNLVAGDTNDFEDVFLRDRSSGTTTRLSLAPGGVQTNGLSRANDISGDGRFVTFESCASNLVAGDSNALCDVFLLDRQTQTIERINVSSAGVEANGQGDLVRGHWSRVSDDGRYVVFVSNAINLVTGTSSATRRLYLRDRQAGTTVLIDPGRSPAISSDGRYVAYASPSGIRLWDRQTGTSEEISTGVGGAPENNFSDWPSLSDDGRYVAFYSFSSNLVADDGNGNEADVFVRDRQLVSTTLVSRQVGAAERVVGGSIAEISGNGRYVVYVPGLSSDGDFFDSRGMFCDLQTGEIKSFVALSDVANGRDFVMRPRISSDGSTVVFAAFGLSRSAVDISGDIPDVFVSAGAQNDLFGDGFE